MLADVMGLGKTAQIIRASDCLAEPLTIICPAILRRNWAVELDKFSFRGREVFRVNHGKAIIPPGATVVCSYTLATAPKIKAQLLARRGQVMAFDEAQALKTPRAQRTKAILGRTGIALSASRAWFSTGTPTPNHPGEAYTFFVAAGIFQGTYENFLERFCERRETPFGLKIVGAKNVEEFKRLRAPVYLRRTFDDVGYTLPHLAEPTVIEVDGDTAMLGECDPATLQSIAEASRNGDWSLPDVPSVSTIRRVIGTAKSRAMVDILRMEVEAGETRIICFALHRDLIAAIKQGLAAAGINCASLDGAASPNERARAEDAFQSDAPAPMVLICQIQAASAGLNLTAANRIIFAEWSWTPADNDQAIARAQRRGQTRPVRVSYVSISDSVDKDVVRTNERKRTTLAPLY